MTASSDSMTIHHQSITFVYRQNCYPHDVMLTSHQIFEGQFFADQPLANFCWIPVSHTHFWWLYALFTFTVATTPCSAAYFQIRSVFCLPTRAQYHPQTRKIHIIHHIFHRKVTTWAILPHYIDKACRVAAILHERTVSIFPSSSYSSVADETWYWLKCVLCHGRLCITSSIELFIA